MLSVVSVKYEMLGVECASSSVGINEVVVLFSQYCVLIMITELLEKAFSDMITVVAVAV